MPSTVLHLTAKVIFCVPEIKLSLHLKWSVSSSILNTQYHKSVSAMFYTRTSFSDDPGASQVNRGCCRGPAGIQDRLQGWFRDSAVIQHMLQECFRDAAGILDRLRGCFWNATGIQDRIRGFCRGVYWDTGKTRLAIEQDGTGLKEKFPRLCHSQR